MASPPEASKETAWITHMAPDGPPGEARGEAGKAFTETPKRTIRPELNSHPTPQLAMDVLGPAHADPSTWAVLGTLGQGGMGVVHLAQQERLGRHVAVKRLRADMTGRGAVMSLLREAWVTGALEHPNVVPVHDVGLDADGRPYLVMKRVEGETWGALLDESDIVRDRYGARDVLAWHLNILSAVCNAVHFAHSRGVLHRDLKPENVMVGAFGEVYVLDWGIAVSLDDDHDGRLQLARDVKRMAGTPAYMAPEMLACGALSPSTDVYLLGAMLYEVLTGEPPHLGVRLRADRPARERSVVEPKGPAELVALAMAALHLDPAQRPGSAEVFRQRVAGYLEHRGSDRLAEKAGQRVGELCAMLQTAHGERVRVGPGEVYPLFGECRFGFQLALDAWPANRAAQQGLSRAFRGMIRYELKRGDAQAAERLMMAWPEPEEGLRDEVAQASAESKVLEEARRNLDPSIGLRTRWFIMLVLGFLWTVCPPLYQQYMGGPTPEIALQSAVAFGALMLVAGIWARETLLRTKFNRAMFGTLVLVPVGQTLLSLGAADLGMSPDMRTTLLIFYWFVISGMAAVTLESRVWPGVLAYAVAWLTAAGDPANALVYGGMANGVLTLNLAIAWFPAHSTRFHHSGAVTG